MKLKLALSFALLMALTAAPAAYAHHSFAAEFDGNKPTRLVGKITRVEWTNPHSYFYVDVVDAKGQVTNWGCEGAGPGALTRRGSTSSRLRVFWSPIPFPPFSISHSPNLGIFSL